MPNLKEVRNRIASVRSTQQITAAMKLVAASKLRKAQNAIVKLRPYAVKQQEILGNLSGALEEADLGAFTEVRETKKVLIVAFSSNRGLCGAFNTNVIKKVRSLMEEDFPLQSTAGGIDLILVGRKAGEHFEKRGYSVKLRPDDQYDDLSFEKVVPLADSLMQSFRNKEYDRIILVYNQFKNAASQFLVAEQFLPVVQMPTGGKTSAPTADYIFEPSRNVILRELLPKILKIQLYKAILDSFASEHGARMTAMQQATDNAKELLRGLQLSYNKARQAAITTEILEIVSGANALKEG